MDKPIIQLTGMDGNIFGIIAKSNRAIRAFNKSHPDEQINQEEFLKEMTSGDYDHAIQTVMKYFTVS